MWCFVWRPVNSLCSVLLATQWLFHGSVTLENLIVPQRKKLAIKFNWCRNCSVSAWEASTFSALYYLKPFHTKPWSTLRAPSPVWVKLRCAHTGNSTPNHINRSAGPTLRNSTQCNLNCTCVLRCVLKVWAPDDPFPSSELNVFDFCKRQCWLDCEQRCNLKGKSSCQGEFWLQACSNKAQSRCWGAAPGGIRFDRKTSRCACHSFYSST